MNRTLKVVFVLCVLAIMIILGQPYYTPLAPIGVRGANAQSNTPVTIHQHVYHTTIKAATCTEPGVQWDECHCGDTQNTVLFPAYGHTYTQTLSPASCEQNGEITYICTQCQEVCHETIPAVGHDWTSWTYTQPKPNADGRQTRYCRTCHQQEEYKLAFQFVDNDAVYIESANIHVALCVANFTQEDVDRYDVIYSKPAPHEDPIILGHRTGTLKSLHKTQIGDVIYVNLNGEMKAYQVMASEYAMLTKSKVDIVGQSTGISMWHNYETETLCLYTCHGSNKDGRWLVMAKQIKET